MRAAALVGLGRVLRQRADRPAALQAYADLEQLGTVLVAGQPAGLVARQGRCKVLEDTGDAERLNKAAADLAGALNSGRWPIDRTTFDFYRDMLAHWNGSPPSPEAIARTEAALELWRAWRRGDLAPRGRRLVHHSGGPVLALWSGGPERPVAWIASAAEIETSWRAL